MSFSVTYTGGFNPFEWKDLKCPVCGANDYVSMDHTGVYCNQCYAEFKVRYTTGDPGCVVDCFVDEVYAPLWECMDCGEQATFLEWQTPACPEHPAIHKMRRVEGIGKLWKPPQGFPKSYYLVLKLGDYCSGWLGENWVKDRSQRLGHPTQEQWDRFQAENEIAWPRHGARWAIL